MVLIGVVTFVLMTTDFQAEGYLYLFFYSIPSNTAISVFPHEPVLIYYGKFADLWLTAAAATGGTMVAGWLDHRVFVPVLNYSKLVSYKKNRFYQKSTDLFMRYPFTTLVVTGLTPIPFWPFKFLCFSIHYPLWRYLAALAAGRFPRYVLLAWIGAEFGIPNWILILSVVVIFALYAIKGIPAVWRRFQERRQKRRENADTFRV
jgi:membrane protein YqaA with SNARE-associated domain